MVFQQAQNAVSNLKDRPKDEKKVVAGGIAIAVVVVLFFTWAIFFLKKIQSGEQQLEFGGGAQDEFLPGSVRDAQQAILNDNPRQDELETARQQSIERRSQVQTSGQGQVDLSDDAFGPSQ